MADTRGCPHHGRPARLKLRGRGLSARKAVFVPRCASHLRGHAVWSEPVPASAVASLRALELGNRPGPIGGTGANGARRTRREAAVGAAPPPGRKQPGGVGGTQRRVGRVTGLFHPRGWQTGRRLDSHSSHVRVRMAPRKGRRGGSPQNERRGGGVVMASRGGGAGALGRFRAVWTCVRCPGTASRGGQTAPFRAAPVRRGQGAGPTACELGESPRRKSSVLPLACLCAQPPAWPLGPLQTARTRPGLHLASEARGHISSLA